MMSDEGVFLLPKGKTQLRRENIYEKFTKSNIYFRSTVLFLFFILTLVITSFNKHTSGFHNNEFISSMWTSMDAVQNSNQKIQSTESETSIITTTNKPNVVFILADDLGWNSLGDAAITTDLADMTPFLSSTFINKGISMTNYYSHELCTPGRAAFLTGRYPIRYGLQEGTLTAESSYGVALDETLWPSLLQSNGYISYMLGKWNLGNKSPRYLPTARGFDYYLGYMSGATYYWSKELADYENITDLMYSNTDCYYGYNGSDINQYSTFFYRDKAISIIENHNFTTNPLLLYLAFQAVHDPFGDDNYRPDGLTVTDVSREVYDKVMLNVVGVRRQQYAMALYLLDDAIGKVYEAMESVQQADNTFFIFTSDNGGCYAAGGRNGPLRGSKATLWEGGTKVDAIVYSSTIPVSKQGTSFKGLMHVTDWFSTILDLVGIEYTAEDGYALDSVSHYDAIMAESSSNESKREYLLYNIYMDSDDDDEDIYDDMILAIRSSQFKLIHAFENNTLSKYYSYGTELANDDIIDTTDTDGKCSISTAQLGDYGYFLYEIAVDPYETNNLYYDSSYDDIKATMYDALLNITSAGIVDHISKSSSKICLVVFKEHDNHVVPWVNAEDLSNHSTYPSYCTFYDAAVSPVYEE